MDRGLLVCHKYDPSWLLLRMASRGLPIECDILVKDNDDARDLIAMFPNLNIWLKELTKYYEWAAKHRFFISSYCRVHTYGRTAVENACLGIPHIGSSVTSAMDRLWPELCVDPQDAYGMNILANRLISDQTFFDDVVGFAYEQVEHYSYDARKQAFLEMLDGKVVE